MPRHRYAVLDTYRFFAALGVVLYHFEGNLSPLRGRQTDVLDRFQTLVDFFFVLSGFVLMHTYGARIRTLGTYATFLRKRIARILPLQVATVMICVALAGLVAWRHIPVRDPAFIDLALAPQNLMLVHAWGTTHAPGLNFPSWSISAEAFVYLLFPLFAVLIGRIGPRAALVAALLGAILIEFFRASLGLRPGYLATFDFGMLRAVPTFLAGMAVCRLVEARPATPVSWHLPNALLAIVLMLMLVRAPIPLIVTFYPPLVGLIAAADRGGRPTHLASRSFVALGNASFAIYMLHTFVEVACVAVARKMGWTALPALYAITAVGTVIIVLCGLVSYKLFETPLRRLIGGTAPAAQVHARPRDSVAIAGR